MVNPTARLRLALMAVLVAAIGCGDFNSGGPGMDGGGGTAGVFGRDSGPCIECSPGCFDCSGNCFICSMAGTGGSAGFDENDAGEIIQPWTSPFPNTGDHGGWRETGDDLLCMAAVRLANMSVWSDERGVYAMGDGAFAEHVFLEGKATRLPARAAKDAFIDAGAGAAPPPMDAGAAGGAGFTGGAGGFGGFGGGSGSGGFGGVSECFLGAGQCNGYAIYFHDGESGWRREHSVSTPWDSVPHMRRLSGLPVSELVVHDSTGSFSNDCTLLMLDGSVERCDQSGSPIVGVFAVDAQLAYAAVGTTLLVYDGALWTAHPTPLPFVPNALWANATDVVIVGQTGRIARLRDGGWTSDNQTIRTLTAVWGGAGEELWVGTDAGQVLRRDAQGTWLPSLEVAGFSCDLTEPIVGIWGSGSTVYIHTPRALARWNGSELRDLANWTCALPDLNFGENTRRIRSIWGNGPDELFVGVTDTARFFDSFSDSCGDGFVMYFDGTTFHRL